MPTLTPTTSIAQLQPAPRALAGSVSTPALPRPKQPSSRPSSSRPTSSSRSRVKLYSPVQPPLVPSVSTATLKHFSCDLDEAALSGIFRRGTPAPPCASIRSADLQKFTRVSRFELDPTKLLDVALREASRVSLDARLQAENLSRDVNDPILPANSAARHAARTLVGRGLKVSQRLLASLERLTIAASDSAVTLGARLASTTEQLGTGFAAFSRELQAVEAEQARHHRAPRHHHRVTAVQPKPTCETPRNHPFQCGRRRRRRGTARKRRRWRSRGRRSSTRSASRYVATRSPPVPVTTV